MCPDLPHMQLWQFTCDYHFAWVCIHRWMYVRMYVCRIVSKRTLVQIKNCENCAKYHKMLTEVSNCMPHPVCFTYTNIIQTNINFFFGFTTPFNFPSSVEFYVKKVFICTCMNVAPLIFQLYTYIHTYTYICTFESIIWTIWRGWLAA